MTPTREGWHWCQVAGWDEPTIHIVTRDAKTNKLVFWFPCPNGEPEGSGHFLDSHDCQRGVTFGPRIPSPARLEAMEKLVKLDPWDDIDRKGNTRACRHCGVVWHDTDDPAPEHKADCLWAMAQEGGE